VLLEDERIARVGDIGTTEVDVEIDAGGLHVIPGLINVLSHAYFTLQDDPRGLSDLHQGVTTEIFGEGGTLGPLAGVATVEMLASSMRHPELASAWPTAVAFLDHLEARGVGFNVASFVGAVNLRMSQVGLEQGALTAAQREGAAALLDAELTAGALGVGSALIYPPASSADTDELLAYARVLARHDATYISHMRSEGAGLIEAVDELIFLARESGARAEIYHLKAVGRENWHKFAAVLDRVDAARAEGVRVTADIYPYEAGSTALASCIPPRYRDGVDGLERSLADPAIRAEIKREIAERTPGWENMLDVCGGPDGVLVLSSTPALGLPNGLTLTEIARRLGDDDPVDAMFRVVTADRNTPAAYFMADEANTRLGFRRPWVSVGSDSDAPTSEAVAAGHPTHPRAFGAFARVLSVYARDEGIVSVEEAVRRMTSLPASTHGIADRGTIRPGAFADVAILDLAGLDARATYLDPGRYATGVQHVLVNGVATLADGAPTGRLPGRALRRSRSAT
jgi:N-acyl-D-amino-acid deacylase